MNSVYEMITDKIIAELDKGVCPWKQPWYGVAQAVSHSTGKPYSLLNQILLDGESGEYLTYRQAEAEGGHVKRGEKGRTIVFWKWMYQEDEETHKMKKYPILKKYSVFNINQCEGIKAKYDIKMENKLKPNAKAEAIANGYVDRSKIKFEVKHSDRAYYSPREDMVVIPELSQYSYVPEYYSTMFHELTHSTGAQNRLNRDMSGMFGSEKYSKEELCAELGASFLVNNCGIETNESFKNNAAYIQSWLRVLKNDKRMIISAATQADKAVKMILGEEEIEEKEE